MIFNLKKEWFNKIKSGEKTHEYRLCTPYWNKRIEKLKRNVELQVFGKLDYTKSVPKQHYLIIFALGYPKKNDAKKRIVAEVIGVTKHNGINTDLKIEQDIWDIKFKLRNDIKF